MALIIHGKTICALCQETFATSDDIVGTAHFIADPKDSLSPYSDAAFHRQCFIAWERREEFVMRFNEIMKPYVFGNGKFQQMELDGSIIQVEARR